MPSDEAKCERLRSILGKSTGRDEECATENRGVVVGGSRARIRNSMCSRNALRVEIDVVYGLEVELPMILEIDNKGAMEVCCRPLLL